MGFHICEWCEKNDGLKVAHIFRPTSSQDVVLEFDNGRAWQFPHVGLLHYVTSHDYRPPDDFIMDVMTAKVISHQFMQTKGIRPQPVLVGYLKYPDLTEGHVPTGFVEHLASLVRAADWTGNVHTTRGFER